MGDKKINFNKVNLISGEIKEAKDNLENLKDFSKRWKEKIKEIKLICLNNQQAYNLANDYLSEWEKFMPGEELINKHFVLNQLAHDLFLAISQANNNYREKFPSFWNNFHKLKLPDLNLVKKG